jgi:membrane associated rhomboid family serine protease
MAFMTRPRWQSFEVVAIAIVTLAIFFHQQSLRPMDRLLFDERYGAVPSVMLDAWQSFRADGLTPGLWKAALPLLTANYLHADVSHVGGNLLFFWIFGNVLSQAVGRRLLVVTYLFGGAVAVLVYAHTNPTSEVPMLGASGAIAGLEGAYFTLVLRWEMAHATVWPLEGFIAPGRLAFLAIVNFVLDTGSFVGHARTHVAYGAHVGGFLGGAFIAMVIASVRGPEWREG